MDKLTIQNSNTFTDAYNEFVNTRLAKRLAEKYKSKPYYKRNKSLQILALVSSYVFNVFSGFTASTLIYFFVYSMTGFWLPSLVATLVFLCLLEIAKRLTTTSIFKNLFHYRKWHIFLSIVALSMISISVTFSYYGSIKVVQRFTIAPTLENIDSLTLPIQTKIIDIDKQIKEARQTKWLGTTTTTSQRTIEALTKQKTALENELISTRKRINTINDRTEIDHHEKTYLNGKYFAMITLVLELLFLLSVWYLEYFDFRAYTEFATVINDNDNHTVNFAYTRDYSHLERQKDDKNKSTTEIKENVTVSPKMIVIDNTDKETIQKAIKQVKGKISSAKYRIRNKIGKPETSKRNIERFEKELTALIYKLSR